MRKMNAISRIPEVSGTMEEMRRQMAMCADAEDAIEDALRDDGEEQEAATEVQKVLEEMALDQLGPLAKAAVAAPAVQQAAPAAPEVPAAPERQAVAVGEGYSEPAPKPAPKAPAPSPDTASASAGSSSAYSAADVPKAPEQATVAPSGPAPAAAPAPEAAGSSVEDDLMKRLEMLKKP